MNWGAAKVWLSPEGATVYLVAAANLYIKREISPEVTAYRHCFICNKHVLDNPQTRSITSRQKATMLSVISNLITTVPCKQMPERRTRGKSVKVTERLYSPGTAETTKSGTMIRPKASALPVVPAVNRASTNEDGPPPTTGESAAILTTAFKGVTSMGESVETPTGNNQRLLS